MTSKFFEKIYDSWKTKQLQKYHSILPKLKPFLKNNISLLDLGVGQAWLEEFLQRKGFQFSRILGVDVSEEAITPRKKGIEYVLTTNFKTEEKFDFLVCFDAFHLLKNQDVLRFLKEDGLALISLPERWQAKLKLFPEELIQEKGKAGLEEIDHFIIMKNK